MGNVIQYITIRARKMRNGPLRERAGSDGHYETQCRVLSDITNNGGGVGD